MDATVAERASTASDRLSPAESRVARFFVDHSEEAAFLSAAEIGAHLGTSDATVVRAVKALGYAGLGELRRELADALRSRATPAIRLGRSLESAGDDPASVADHVLSLQAEFIEEARVRLRPEDIERAVELLARADRVVACGIGPSGALAEYVSVRLGRFGHQTVVVNETGLRLADALQQLRHGDALVLLAHESLDPDSEVTLVRANELKLPVILVTDTLGPKLASRIDVALSASRSAAGAFGASAPTLALLEALLLALAVRERSSALGSLAQLNELRSRLRAEPLER